MRFNLKSYWREIVIVGLLGLLIWVTSRDQNYTKVIGSTDTICIIDTIVKQIPTYRTVEYVTKLVTRITRDTIITVIDAPPMYINDTSWIYADIPLNEYRDSSYYIKTIGWLDSVVLFNRNVAKKELQNHELSKLGNLDISIFANTITGHQLVAPGVQLNVKKLQLGYNYNLIDQQSAVTVGYRLY